MARNWLGKFVGVIGLAEPVKAGSVRTASRVWPVPGYLERFRMRAVTSLASARVAGGVRVGGDCGDDAAVQVAAGRGHGGADRGGRRGGALLAAQRRSRWCCPVPLTAVTSRISEPMATEKFGVGNPVSLTTVIEDPRLRHRDRQRGAGREQRGDRLLDGTQVRGDVGLGHLRRRRPAAGDGGGRRREQIGEGVEGQRRLLHVRRLRKESESGRGRGEQRRQRRRGVGRGGNEQAGHGQEAGDGEFRRHAPGR